MAELICVAFPTIMDGLVLRWYRDLTAYEIGSEMLSASRNGVRISCYLHEVPGDTLNVATTAAVLLAGGQGHEVKEMATHRTGGVFSRKLEPITREPVDG